ncbi:hypothetical protein CBS101457_003986 [Exobasidium rhododendri]|nr:hypothetical protein CBS101457_003986 [Exobasidium rhododendri]
MQYVQLIQPGNCPEGIYISLSEQLDTWNGVIFVHKGYYRRSVYNFEVTFPAAYPHVAPIVHFEKNSVVHPLVDPKDYRLSLSLAFPKWNANTDTPTKLLFFIKSIFKTYTLNKLNDGLVSNDEAWRLHQFNRPLFAKLAAQCATVSASSNTLFGGRNSTATSSEREAESTTGQPKSRPSKITFKQLDETELQAIRLSIFEEQR